MLLDCTLRDGGYYTNWEYSLDLIKDLVIFHNQFSNIAFEFGYFNLIDNQEFKGLCAESPSKYLSYLFKKFTGEETWKKDKKVFAMINSNELIKLEEQGKSSLLKEIEDSLFFNGIRIATDNAHLEEVLDFLEVSKEKKIFSIINIMKIDKLSQIEKNNILKSLEDRKTDLRPDVVYFADSFGSLFVEETQKIIKFFNKPLAKLGIEVGFHAHNNKGLALANTFGAIKEGATWFDGSWLGMGRGAGNAELEHLILNNLLEGKSVRYKSEISSKSQNLIEKYFLPLKDQYKWGKNIFYDLSATVSLHPTKCLDLINSHKLSTYSKAFSIISSETIYEPNKKSSLFSKDIFSENLNKIPILIYSGQSSVNNITSLNFLEETSKFFLLRINYSSILDTLNSNLIITSSSKRLIQFLAQREKIEKNLKCIIPISCSKFIPSEVNNYEKIFLYKSDTSYKYSIHFALELLTNIGYKEVKVIGLDGKNSLTLKDKKEFNDTEKIITHFSDKLKIESLTNTPYSIKLTPIYSLMK